MRRRMGECAFSLIRRQYQRLVGLLSRSFACCCSFNPGAAPPRASTGKITGIYMLQIEHGDARNQ